MDTELDDNSLDLIVGALKMYATYYERRLLRIIRPLQTQQALSPASSAI
jgi:hypothetical protein